MTGLEGYFLFAVSVALWACYELMRPALALIEDKENDNLYQNKLTAYFTIFCISCLVAPLVVVLILVPGAHEKTVWALANKRD